MKKFSELVVGDKIYIWYDEEIFEKEVSFIEKDNKGIFINTRWSSWSITHQKDDDFFIAEYSVGVGIREAIATSMDRLLLECEEC